MKDRLLAMGLGMWLSCCQYINPILSFACQLPSFQVSKNCHELVNFSQVKLIQSGQISKCGCRPVGKDVFDSIDVEQQGTLTKSGIAKVRRGNPEAQVARDILTD